MQYGFLNFNIELRKNIGFDHKSSDDIVGGQFDRSADDFEFELGVVEFFLLIATHQIPVFKDVHPVPVRVLSNKITFHDFFSSDV